VPYYVAQQIVAGIFNKEDYSSGSISYKKNELTEIKATNLSIIEGSKGRRAIKVC
jgi:hypothetical protein